MKAFIEPGIVLGNLACLFGLTFYAFWRGTDSLSEYNLVFEAAAFGFCWIVFVVVMAFGAMVLSASYQEAKARFRPYVRGLVISIPVLLLGWAPATLVAWNSMP